MNGLGILVVTGASGAGKTEAVRQLAARNLRGVECFHFDSIGVPSEDERQRKFGGDGKWQEDATRRWMVRLAKNSQKSIRVLDGQTRPSFVLSALPGVEPVKVRIVLLECNPIVRTSRLVQRGQPELANPTMESWAIYLRGEADNLELPVLDTSDLTVDEVTDWIEAQVRDLVREPK